MNCSPPRKVKFPMNSHALMLMAIPALVALAGGVLAAVWAPSHQTRIYLVTEELLMEAHEVEEKPFFTLVLFAGFLVFWAIQLFGPG